MEEERKGVVNAQASFTLIYTFALALALGFPHFYPIMHSRNPRFAEVSGYLAIITLALINGLAIAVLVMENENFTNFNYRF